MGGSREEWGMGWRREKMEDGWEKEDNRGLRRKYLRERREIDNCVIVQWERLVQCNVEVAGPSTMQ